MNEKQVQHTDSLTIHRVGVSLNLSPIEYRDGKSIRLACTGVDGREDRMRIDRADAKRLMDYLAVQLAMWEEPADEPPTPPEPGSDFTRTMAEITADPIRAYLEQRMKDGGVVTVTRIDTRYKGHVVKIDPVSKVFLLAMDGENIPFIWTDSSTKVLLPAEPTWKPKVGDECLIVDTDESVPHVDVWAIHGNHAWLGRHGDPKDVTGWTQHITWLRPLPPESPKLQYGDVVCIKVDGIEFFGRVFDVLPGHFRMTGYEEDVPYGSVVCKMVPEAK